MITTHFTPSQIFGHGMIVGMQAALISSFLLTLFFTANIFYLEPTERVEFLMIEVPIFMYVLGSNIILPNAISGIFFLWFINKLSQSKPIYLGQTVLIGLLVGLETAAGVLILLFLLGPSEPFTWNEIVYITLASLLSGGSAGGIMAHRFMKRLLNKQEKLLTMPDDSVHFTAETPF